MQSSASTRSLAPSGRRREGVSVSSFIYPRGAGFLLSALPCWCGRGSAQRHHLPLRSSLPSRHRGKISFSGSPSSFKPAAAAGRIISAVMIARLQYPPPPQGAARSYGRTTRTVASRVSIIHLSRIIECSRCACCWSCGGGSAVVHPTGGGGARTGRRTHAPCAPLSANFLLLPGRSGGGLLLLVLPGARRRAAAWAGRHNHWQGDRRGKLLQAGTSERAAARTGQRALNSLSPRHSRLSRPHLNTVEGPFVNVCFFLSPLELNVPRL